MTPAMASRTLAARDGLAAELLRRHGPCRLGRRPRRDERFARLARSIAYQQLSGAAAGTIWGRVTKSLGTVDPATVRSAGAAPLRAAGMSAAKATAVLELAEAVEAGTVDLSAVDRLPDEDVVAHLTAVRGIGPWTADMFLLFALHRLDVWPVGDAGVRAGWARINGLDDAPGAAELTGAADAFRPFRSVLAWWCWRELDTETP